MTEKKIIPGQVVFVKKVGNAARWRKEDELVEEEIVERVGKKYFYLQGFRNHKFSIEEMRDISDYTSDFYVYLTMQEIKDEAEYALKVKEISKVFDHYGRVDLSLEVIRQLHDILKTAGAIKDV